MNSNKFNQSQFSRWINSQVGRVFRVLAGLMFIVIGMIYRESGWEILAIIWGFFPLMAGLFDLCFISFVLGGPIQGAKIRELQS